MSCIEECLVGSAPVVAAPDFVSAYAGLIATFIGARYAALGTDALGAATRRWWSADSLRWIAITLRLRHFTLSASRARGNPALVSVAIKQYGIGMDAIGRGAVRPLI